MHYLPNWDYSPPTATENVTTGRRKLAGKKPKNQKTGPLHKVNPNAFQQEAARSNEAPMISSRLIGEELEPRLLQQKYITASSPYIRNFTSELLQHWKPYWIGVGYFLAEVFTTLIFVYFQGLAYIVFPGSMGINVALRTMVVGGAVFFVKFSLGRWTTAYLDLFRSVAATFTFLLSRDKQLGKPKIWLELVKLLLMVIAQFGGALIAWPLIKVTLGGNVLTKDCLIDPTVACSAYPVVDTGTITVSDAHFLEALGGMLIYGMYVFSEREFGFKWIRSSFYSAAAVAGAHMVVHGAFGPLSGGSFNFWYWLTMVAYTGYSTNAAAYTWPAMIGYFIVFVVDLAIIYLRVRLVNKNKDEGGPEDEEVEEDEYVMGVYGGLYNPLENENENGKLGFNVNCKMKCPADDDLEPEEDDGVLTAWPGYTVPHIRNYTIKLLQNWTLWRGLAYFFLEVVGMALFVFFQAFVYIKYPGSLGGNPITRAWVVGLISFLVRFMIGRLTTTYLDFFRSTAATFTFVLYREKRLGDPKIWLEFVKWLIFVVAQFAGAMLGVVLIKLALGGPVITSDCALDFAQICDAKPVVNTLVVSNSEAHWMEGLGSIFIYASMIWGERAFGFFLIRSSLLSAVMVGSSHFIVHLIFAPLSGGSFNFWYWFVIAIFTGDFTDASARTWPPMLGTLLVFLFDVFLLYAARYIIDLRKEKEDDVRRQN